MSEEAEEGSLMMLRDEEELEWPDLEGEERFARIRSRSEKFFTSRSGRERSKSRSLVRMSFVTGEVFNRDSNNY